MSGRGGRGASSAATPQGGGRGGYGGRGRGGGGDFRGGRGGGGDFRGGRGGGRGGRGGGPKPPTTAEPGVPIVANFFNVIDLGGKRYKTGINFGGVASRRVRRLLAEKLIQKLIHDSKDKNIALLFDGTNLYSQHPIDEGKTYTIKMNGEDYIVETTKCQEIFITGNKINVDTQTFNIIINQAMEAGGFTRMGRNFYDADTELDNKGKQDLRQVYLHPGYSTEVCVRRMQNGPALVINLDTLTKVISRRTALTWIEDMQRLGLNQEQINRRFRGTVVMTSYNYKTYVVNAIDFTKSPADTFPLRTQTGTENISFAAYNNKLAEDYEMPELRVTNMKQPLIKVRGREGESIYLVPQNALWVEIPREAKQHLPVVCSVKPTERARRLKDLVDFFHNEEGARRVLQRFKLQVDAKMIPVNAKHLPVPRLLMMTKNGQTQLAPRGNFGRDAQSIVATSQPVKCAVYLIAQGPMMKWAQGWVAQQLNNMSKNIRSPINFTGVTALDGTDKKFEDVVNKINPPSDAKEVLVILAVSGRTKDADYASGKIACVRRGFYCQAIQAKERSEDDPSRGMSILTNIARQIVNKRGEFLWNFNAHELCPAWKNKTILAIGYDVYHGKAEVTAAGVWQKRSIGAGVSFTIKGTQWRARCDAHERQARSEIGNEGKRSTTDTLEGTTATDFLRNFVEQTIKTQNLDYKDLIVVVFRDGVAESQLDECNRSEVPQIVTAAGGSLGAEVYFLVIQKATHARFLADMGNGEYLNPPAGTIIDKDLTFMNHKTFYLVPTTTSLSTSRPINYVVLYSPPNADIDTLQKFTFAMHWVYPNWTDAIKLPAPTQCAHKMAFLLGECGDMKPVINDRLKDSLFFL